jgi:hypothetical protein
VAPERTRAGRSSRTEAKHLALICLAECFANVAVPLIAGIFPRLLSSGDFHTFRGLFDETCDSFRLRHVDGVAPLYLNDR